ncbi:MCE family protein [Spirillospora albida]|uniref:MCE family protein n=1 Tax=Spirillospora albida TaxID=58123 RepID=UPI0004BE667C|nr:MlaD family protein [Spirillospora albida]
MSPRRKAARGPEYSTIAKFAVFVAVTGLLTFYIGQQILGASFRDRYTLTATFDDVTGLLTGDAVKIAGAPVGQVASIDIVRGKAVVGLEVDEGVAIPSDSTAAIRWRNVMGQRVVYLEPGRQRARLGDGGRIPHTRSAVDLGELVNNLGPLTRNLDPNQLNKILFSFSQALEGNEQNIAQLTDNLDLLLQTFAARRSTIKQMIDNYETVAGVIAKRDHQIAASVDNLESLTRVFANNHKVLENAIVELGGVTTNLNAVLGGNDAQLARIIGNLSEVAETFRLNVDQLEKMVQGLPLTMRQLFAAANGGHYLRTNALCLNVVQGPCPFEMKVPRTEGSGGGSPTGPSKSDLAKLKAMLSGGAG